MGEAYAMTNEEKKQEFLAERAINDIGQADFGRLKNKHVTGELKAAYDTVANRSNADG